MTEIDNEAVERVKVAVRNEWGSRLCREKVFDQRECDIDNAKCACRDVARAAIAAMPGWRTIESAPKDGTRILAYEITDADDTQPQIVCWLGAPDKPGWYVGWDHTPCDGTIWKPPTHWIPLPAPPKPEGA